MTTITATDDFAGAFNDLDASSVAGLAAGTAGTQDTGVFEIIVGNTLIAFNGSGFGSYSSNFPGAGTITSVEISEFDSGTSQYIQTATWTALSVLATDLADWATAADPAQGFADFIEGFFGGSDTMNGADSFEDALYGYGGNDNIRTFDGDDTAHGGDGNDYVIGDFGTDHMYGDAGDDIVYAFDGTAGDIYDGGTGGETNGDQLFVFGENTVDLRLAAISNFEQLTFGPFDTLVANLIAEFSSSQIASGFSASLTINGSTFSTDQVYIVMDGTSLSISGWQIGSNWLTTEEVRIAGTASADTITGWEGRDNVGGGLGADTIHTGAGNDAFYGSVGDGADQMYGGVGDDNYGVFDAGDVIHELVGEGTADRAAVWVNNYVLGDNVEIMVLYGSGDVFNGTGNASANTMEGNALNNVLTGLGGIDTFFAGDGNDTLIGGAGADVLHGEGGSDSASYATSATRVSVNLNTGVTAYGDAAGDTFDSIENLIGSAFNDILTGDGGANIIFGGDGADTLSGLGGIDTMIGGNGDDTYVVDVAGDATTETSAAGGIDTVQSAATRTLGANLENLTLTGALAINGTGNGLNNTLTGNVAANILNGLNGVDTLLGGGGADTLNGGLGHDTLTGGNAADKFVFNVAAKVANSDTITDFTHNSDKIQLENGVFTALAATGALASTKFVVGATAAAANAHDGDDFIIYNSTTGQLFYDDDGNGSHTKVLIATLTGHPTLSASDIQII